MTYNFLDESGQILREAGRIGGIDPNVMAFLEAPGRVVSFRIPLKMDDGSFRVFDAHRVRYNDALGPSRDGTRVSPDLDLDEVKSLALIMSIKHAAGRIPAGGGKGGIEADPRELSPREFESLCRAYIRFLRPRGQAYDVPGADIGTDLQTMSWMLDEYESITGYHEPAAVNDKPPILGGSLGGYEATGSGVFDVFRVAAEQAGLEIDGLRVAIQGFGQVGSVAASKFHDAGCVVVAVSDSRGGVFAKEGLNIPELLEHKRVTGKVAGFAGSQDLSGGAMLECDCDVLVPASVQGVITGENAGRIKARMLVEAANAPTTVKAEALLLEKGTIIVPDVLANAGSVQLCQMERSQGLSDNYWDLETINRLRQERLAKAYREAVDTAAGHGLKSVRLGAWINGLKRMEEAMHLRGWC
ncbi:Glu/Leu/Phe/Val dehydrogenase [Marinobacter santoriniensis NKSG1]|uniref:Glutamate dehydrogenase n=1 Tax=Marinobacter santoriniensis NKSG1 TaxID=1288826 RepID=M7CMM5_9GAMM|nr:Glu/Leu/Phe/Val dehydrogenase [Marinobacter santoriniensis]EMP54886.1 Glu/Leu/Phe/Val dehydrogenase [Marinobacter santoriniensis NKSG1]